MANLKRLAKSRSTWPREKADKKSKNSFRKNSFHVVKLRFLSEPTRDALYEALLVEAAVYF